MLTCAAQASAASTTVEMTAMSTCGSPWNVPNTCTLVSILATQPAPQLPMHRNGCPRRFPSLLPRRAMCWPASPSWIQQQRVPLANGVCPPPALHAIRAIHQTQPCNQIVRTGYLRCPNVRCLVVHCGHEYVSVASRGKLRCATACTYACKTGYMQSTNTVHCTGTISNTPAQCNADPCTAAVVANSSYSGNGMQRVRRMAHAPHQRAQLTMHCDGSCHLQSFHLQGAKQVTPVLR